MMLTLLAGVLIRQQDIYDHCGNKGVLSKSGSCYRSYVFDPIIKHCARFLRSTGDQVTFLPGEIELQVMSTQLNSQGLTDGRYRYCADGIISVDDFFGLEILLTEVSSGFGNSDTSEISFDHHKAMFGMLSMIRTLAQRYNKGSLGISFMLMVTFTTPSI